MALYIKDPDVRAMARKVAEVRGTTVTEAVRSALAREIADIDGDRARRDRELRELFAKWDSEPPGEPYGDDDMYDENGIPR